MVETRFNVVRSSVPDLVTTARKLRDYLPPMDQRDTPMSAEAVGSPGHTAIGAGIGGRLDGTLRFRWASWAADPRRLTRSLDGWRMEEQAGR